MNIADIRGGKPNSISDFKPEGTVPEETPEKIEGEDLEGKKGLHPEEQEYEDSLKPKDPTPPAPPAPEKKEEAPAPVDYKQKFSESSREAQVIAGKLRETEALLGKLTSENIPSEEELARSVPNYENMTDTERYLVKRQIAVENDNRRILLTGERQRLQAEYSQKLDTEIVTDPRLKGKEAEFREFISKPSRQGVDPETLLSAFLFEVGSQAPSNTTPPARGLAPGVGGSSLGNPDQNKSGYSDEQIAYMRKYDQKTYMDLVRNKKI